MTGIAGLVRRWPRRLVAIGLGAPLAAGLAGCSPGRSSAAPGPTVSANITASSSSASASPSPSPSPSPSLSPKVSHRIGEAVIIRDPSAGSLTVRATGPETSQRKLGSYGYPPRNGHYLVFTVTLTNDTGGQVKLGPLDFFVTVGDADHVTVHDGNAKYSGAGPQLDPTFLSPGQHRSAQITFDVSGTHGRLTYAPDGETVCYWTF